MSLFHIKELFLTFGLQIPFFSSSVCLFVCVMLFLLVFPSVGLCVCLLTYFFVGLSFCSCVMASLSKGTYRTRNRIACILIIKMLMFDKKQKLHDLRNTAGRKKNLFSLMEKNDNHSLDRKSEQQKKCFMAECFFN